MQSIDEYGLFCARVKQLVGIDLSGYKEKQMKRRLESLMTRRGFTSFGAYCDLLARDQEAMLEFTDRVTINVSEFFRNAERWEVLRQKVLPALIANAGQGLRIWSAACSTGEEPYSLAMLLKHEFAQTSCRLLATDLDRVVLDKARKAEYAMTQYSQIPERMRTKYLISADGKFRVDPAIVSGVEFRQHDLLRDQYPEQQDLIVCRNVMIYFTDDIKERLYRNFSSSLRLGGVLFVGSTEQIFRAREYGLKVLEPFFYQKVE